MHPAISYQLAQGRIAELRQRAERETLTRAARRARPGRRRHAAPGGERSATAALIAVDGRIRPWRLGARLGAALEEHLSVAVLGGAEVPGAAVPGDPAGVYGPLLDRAEAGHDLVLLVGGLDLDEPWTKLCLQRGDPILAVTGGGPVPPALRDYPELQACDLVAYDAAPGALDGWAAALDPARSHVIRETELGADVARVARRLAGTSAGSCSPAGSRT